MSLSESEVSNKHKQLKVIYMLAQKSKMGAYTPRKNISFWVGISVMFSSIVLAMYFSSLWFCLGIPLGRIFDLLMQRYSTFENDYDNAINSFFLEYIPANTYAFDEMKNKIQKCGHMDIEEILNWYSREKDFLYGVYRERQLGKLNFLKASTESKFTYHEVKCKKRPKNQVMMRVINMTISTGIRL